MDEEIRELVETVTTTDGDEDSLRNLARVLNRKGYGSDIPETWYTGDRSSSEGISLSPETVSFLTRRLAMMVDCVHRQNLWILVSLTLNEWIDAIWSTFFGLEQIPNEVLTTIERGERVFKDYIFMGSGTYTQIRILTLVKILMSAMSEMSGLQQGGAAYAPKEDIERAERTISNAACDVATALLGHKLPIAHSTAAPERDLFRRI